MRFGIYLGTSLAYNKVFYSSVLCSCYMTCAISKNQVFFFLFVVFTTISLGLKEECLSYSK